MSQNKKLCHRSHILCHHTRLLCHGNYFFRIVMDIDYYKLQANISTFLVSGLLPILLSYGVGEATGNIIITILSYLIVLGVCLWSERFTSSFLTKENPCEEVEVEEIGSDSETA